MTKMTRIEALNHVINGDEITSEVVTRLTEMRDQIAKEKSKSKLNMALVQKIDNFLNSTDEPMTVGEIKANIAELANLSSQKITPMVNHLVSKGSVNLSTAKGRNYYIGAKATN